MINTKIKMKITLTNGAKTARISSKAKREQSSSISNRISTCMCECSKDNLNNLGMMRTQENFENSSTQNIELLQTIVNFSSSTEPSGSGSGSG